MRQKTSSWEQQCPQTAPLPPASAHHLLAHPTLVPGPDPEAVCGVALQPRNRALLQVAEPALAAESEAGMGSLRLAPRGGGRGRWRCRAQTVTAGTLFAQQAR